MKINRWKLALLAWGAMFPFSTLLSYSFSQFDVTAHSPLVVRTFLLSCFLVPYMIFGVFPFMNRRFRKWLEVYPTNAPDAQPYQENQALSTEKG